MSSHPPPTCPSCRELPGTSELCEGALAPVPGELIVCPCCGEILRWSRYLGWRKVRDLRAVPKITPETIREIEDAVRAFQHAKERGET
jgi:hypothetical protein